MMFHTFYIREIPAMLQNPSWTVVFQYLLDRLTESKFNAKTNLIIQKRLTERPNQVIVTASQLAQSTGVTIRSVSGILESLENMGLIKCDRASNRRVSSVTVNVDRFEKWFKLFRVLSYEDKTKFIRAIHQLANQKSPRLMIKNLQAKYNV